MYDDALSLRNFAQELRQHDFERPPQRDIQRYPLKHDRSVAPMPYLLFLANGRASVDRSMVSFILGFHIYTLRRSPSGTRMSLSVPIKSIPRPHTDLHRACAATFIHQGDVLHASEGASIQLLALWSALTRLSLHDLEFTLDFWFALIGAVPNLELTDLEITPPPSSPSPSADSRQSASHFAMRTKKRRSTSSPPLSSVDTTPVHPTGQIRPQVLNHNISIACDREHDHDTIISAPSPSRAFPFGLLLLERYPSSRLALAANKRSHDYQGLVSNVDKHIHSAESVESQKFYSPSSAIACLATPYTPSTMAATHPFFHVEAHVCARHHVRATLQISDDHSPQPQAHFETVYMFKEAAMHAASAAWRRLTLRRYRQYRRQTRTPFKVEGGGWRRATAPERLSSTLVLEGRGAGPTPTETKRAELGRTVGVGGLETSTSVAVFVESSPWPNRAVLVPSSASARWFPGVPQLPEDGPGEQSFKSRQADRELAPELNRSAEDKAYYIKNSPGFGALVDYESNRACALRHLVRAPVRRRACVLRDGAPAQSHVQSSRCASVPAVVVTLGASHPRSLPLTSGPEA
ncbi:hypothetical protein BJ912DRAFT_1082296 [Pholiota molesta]|nr:hypothetical protein BJ912DRAFT_1082296 [Pholiota molesta]